MITLFFLQHMADLLEFSHYMHSYNRNIMEAGCLIITINWHN
jgi:hypothetical protein